MSSTLFSRSAWESFGIEVELWSGDICFSVFLQYYNAFEFVLFLILQNVQRFFLICNWFTDPIIPEKNWFTTIYFLKKG